LSGDPQQKAFFADYAASLYQSVWRTTMFKYKVYHVVPIPGPKPGWRVEGEKALRPSSWHHTKEEAVERGRTLARARKGQLYIHKADGNIETEYTYGHDTQKTTD
jgi:hypothetical protein